MNSLAIFVLFTISLSSFIAYNLYSIKMMKRVPHSVSETYYALNQINKTGYLFQLTLFVSGISLMPMWLDASADVYKFLVFLSCASAVFVGAAPEFEENVTKQVHFISAGICCFCSVLWCILSGHWIIVSAFAILCSAPAIKKIGGVLFWVEVFAFSSVFTSLAKEFLSK